jgi:archaellum component FlaC
MSNLYLFAKGGANPNVLLENQIKGGATKTSENIKRKLTDINTIEGFPKIISELKSRVAYLTSHTALLKEITPQHVKDLQDQVTALKKLINEQANK